MRTALITGATGGLGPSVVEAFLADGWRVVATHRMAGAGLPDGAEGVEADLTDPDDVARAVRAAAGDHERPLRAVANLAGGYRGDQPLTETPIADFEAMFTLNLRPTFLVTRAALPHLTPDGAVVCVASRAAQEPWAGGAAYAASKAAVIAFARTVAKEGVRCNVIVPGMIDTPANRAASPGAKMVPPERIARVVRFLCGDESAALNGAVLPV